MADSKTLYTQKYTPTPSIDKLFTDIEARGNEEAAFGRSKELLGLKSGYESAGRQEESKLAQSLEQFKSELTKQRTLEVNQDVLGALKDTAVSYANKGVVAPGFVEPSPGQEEGLSAGAQPQYQPKESAYGRPMAAPMLQGLFKGEVDTAHRIQEAEGREAAETKRQVLLRQMDYADPDLVAQAKSYALSLRAVDPDSAYIGLLDSVTPGTSSRKSVETWMAEAAKTKEATDRAINVARVHAGARVASASITAQARVESEQAKLKAKLEDKDYDKLGKYHTRLSAEHGQATMRIKLLQQRAEMATGMAAKIAEKEIAEETKNLVELEASIRNVGDQMARYIGQKAVPTQSGFEKERRALTYALGQAGIKFNPEKDDPREVFAKLQEKKPQDAQRARQHYEEYMRRGASGTPE